MCGKTRWTSKRQWKRHSLEPGSSSVTHSRELADLLAEKTGTIPREVIRKDGATWLEGLNMLGEFEED